MFPPHSFLLRSLPALLLLGWLLALFAPLQPARAQTPPTPAWAARYHTSGNSNDASRAMAVDAQGHVYVTGASSDSSGNYSSATVKYDAQGNQLWSAVYSPLAVSSLLVDAQGSVYVSGGVYSSSSLTTIKYDTNGNQLWVRVVSNGGYSGALKADGQGNIYVVASSIIIKYDTNGNQLWSVAGRGGAAVLDAQGSLYTTYGVGGYGDLTTPVALVTVKYDALGKQIWIARYQNVSSYGGASTGIALDAQGNVYINGASNTFYINSSDVVTIKYDNRGKQLWAARYSGNDGYSYGGSGLVVDAQGSVYVSGSGGNPFYHFNDVSVLLKYDTSGNPLWVRRSNKGSGLLTSDTQGSLYIAVGSSNNPLAIAKYDTSGNQLWTLTPYQGAGGVYDSMIALIVDLQGNVYTTGSETPGANTSSPSSYITVKYSATAPTMLDITSQVSVTRSGLRYVRATGLWTQTVTVRSAALASFAGPLYLALDGLNAGVTLSNRAGVTGSQPPLNSPYLSVALAGVGNGDSLFDPGESVTFTLQFSDPSSAPLTYTARVLAGPGTP